jgi:hypothetical protein
MEALMGYIASTASTLRLHPPSKRELKHKSSRIVGTDPPKEATEDRLLLLETLREEAVRVRDEKNLRMKDRYDRRTRRQTFTEGQEVLLYDTSLLKQWSRKLDERWMGPYVVLWEGEKGAYVVELEEGKTKMVSGDHLKAYHRRERFLPSE